MRPILIASLCAALSVASTANADSRPTSGDISLRSGRTNGSGKTLLAGSIGWPGASGEIHFAPSSTVNFGLRGSLFYGSPYMGFRTGLGGAAGGVLRVHVLGSGNLDLSIALEPLFVFGEGALFGAGGIYADNTGLGTKVDAGPLCGLQLTRSVTFIFGAVGSFGYFSIDGGPNPSASDAVGGMAGVVGIEALMSTDTMLWSEMRGGVGFAPEGAFGSRAIFSLAFGIAYLLS